MIKQFCGKCQKFTDLELEPIEGLDGSLTATCKNVEMIDGHACCPICKTILQTVEVFPEPKQEPKPEELKPHEPSLNLKMDGKVYTVTLAELEEKGIKIRETQN